MFSVIFIEQELYSHPTWSIITLYHANNETINVLLHGSITVEFFNVDTAIYPEDCSHVISLCMVCEW